MRIYIEYRPTMSFFGGGDKRSRDTVPDYMVQAMEVQRIMGDSSARAPDVPRSVIQELNLARLLREHKDDACSICLEEYTMEDPPSMQSACTHAFHGHCIAQWAATRGNDACPMCRGIRRQAHRRPAGAGAPEESVSLLYEDIQRRTDAANPGAPDAPATGMSSEEAASEVRRLRLKLADSKAAEARAALAVDKTATAAVDKEALRTMADRRAVYERKRAAEEAAYTASLREAMRKERADRAKR